MEESREKNVALGVVGALIGGLIGAASIVLFGQLGIVSAFSGMILAFCTLKGYELLAKDLSNTGIMVCIAVMLVVPYLADRFSWALVLVEEFGWLLGDSFLYVHGVVAEYGLEAEYWKDLLFIYAFTAVGAFALLKQKIKEMKKKSETAL